MLLESGRVREPWDVIGQWLADFARTNRPDFLDRAIELAQALDPAEGLSRVHRLLLDRRVGRRGGPRPAPGRGGGEERQPLPELLRPGPAADAGNADPGAGRRPAGWTAAGSGSS